MPDCDRLVEAIKSDYRQADLPAADRAMLDFAVKLTLEPSRVRESDIELLRQAGFSDPAIHDVVQVVGLFSYYNRLANGLGAGEEPEWRGRDMGTVTGG